MTIKHDNILPVFHYSALVKVLKKTIFIYS